MEIDVSLLGAMAEARQFLAGFFDGDGTITLKRPATPAQHPRPYAALSQAYNSGVPPELVHVQSRWGGSMLKSRGRTDKRRDTWMLSFDSATTSTLLESVVERHGISKRLEARLALDYIHSERANPQEAFDQLVAAKKDRQDLDIDPERITPAYLAGLFVADGTVTLNRGLPFANIAAKRCIKLLRAIRDKLGYGTVYDYAGWIGFNSANAVAFLQMIRPHLPSCQKLPQLVLVLEHAGSSNAIRGKRKTPEEKEKAKTTLTELKRLKRL